MIEDHAGYQRLISDLGHDLRTPLTVVRGAATLLLQSIDDIPRDRQLEMLDLIDREAESMSDRIEDLLALAALGAGRLRLTVDQVGLSEILGAVVEWARRRPAGGALVVVDAHDSMRVRADEERAVQALRCLVGIAIQRVPGEVRIRVRPDTSAVRIEVPIGAWDGLDVYDQELFGALPAAGQVQARGRIEPGLARDLARAMGGEVRLERLASGEAAFSFTLLNP